eukprot:999111-Prymnesium_polylepis.1
MSLAMSGIITGPWAMKRLASVKLPPQHVSASPSSSCRPAPWTRTRSRAHPSWTAVPIRLNPAPMSDLSPGFHRPRYGSLNSCRASGEHRCSVRLTRAMQTATSSSDLVPKLPDRRLAKPGSNVKPPTIPRAGPIQLVDVVVIIVEKNLPVGALETVARWHYQDAMSSCGTRDDDKHVPISCADKLWVEFCGKVFRRNDRIVSPILHVEEETQR